MTMGELAASCNDPDFPYMRLGASLVYISSRVVASVSIASSAAHTVGFQHRLLHSISKFMFYCCNPK